MSLIIVGINGVSVVLLAIAIYGACQLVTPPGVSPDVGPKLTITRLALLGMCAITALLLTLTGRTFWAPAAEQAGLAVLTTEACTALRTGQPPVQLDELPGGLCRVEYLADGPLRLTVAAGVFVSQVQVVALTRRAEAKR